MQKPELKIALVILSTEIKNALFFFHILIKKRRQRECEINGEKTNTLSKRAKCKELSH